MGDLRVALEMADLGLSQFPIIRSQVLFGYREGELESWDDYTWYNDVEPTHVPLELVPAEINGDRVTELPNGHIDPMDIMDIDTEAWWEGTNPRRHPAYPCRWYPYPPTKLRCQCP